MPYDIAGHLRIANPVGNYLQSRDAARNALMQQDQQAQDQQIKQAQLNALMDNQNRQVEADKVAQAKAQQEAEQQDHQKLYVWMQNLAASADKPQQFNFLAQRILQTPLAQKYRLAPEDLTPESIQEYLAASRAEAGVAPNGGQDTRVQSAQILANGNLGYLTTDGRVVDTGQKAKEQLQLTDLLGGKGIINLRTGQPTMITSPEAEIAAAANKAGAVSGAQSAATNAASNAQSQMQNEKAFSAYTAAMSNLATRLGQTATGPIYGLTPALTANQQLADSAIAAVSPILKSLFRTAGEGTFTDRDQKLLTDMIPTRKMHPEARALAIQNIDAIVKSKLGISDQPQAEAPQANQKGWPLMIDAAGNRAYVGPNGEVEEVQ